MAKRGIFVNSRRPGIGAMMHNTSAQERETFVSRLVDTCLGLRFGGGYDYFISYSREDGEQYAEELAKELMNLQFRCFLDRNDFEKGQDWKREASRALKRTNCLLLVVTPAALQSKPVWFEIEEFKSILNDLDETRRSICPLDIAGTWGSDLAGPMKDCVGSTILAIPEDGDLKVILCRGPSPHVLTELQRKYNLRRQEDRRVHTFLCAAAALSLFGLLAIVFGVLAWWQRSVALHEQERAESNLQQRLVHRWRELTDSGDLLTSIMPLAEVLSLETKDKRAADVHRIRLGTTLVQCPELKQVLFHESRIHCLAFSPDGASLVTGGSDGAVTVWDVSTGYASQSRIRQPQSGQMRPNGVTHVAYNRSGDRILFGYGNHAAGLWNPKTAELIGSPMFLSLPTTHGHFDVELSLDGRFVVMAGGGQGQSQIPVVPQTSTLRPQGLGNTVGLGRGLVQPLPQPVPVLSSPLREENNFGVWSAVTAHPIQRFLPCPDKVFRVIVSPDGTALAVAGRQDVWIWSLEEGEKPKLRHRLNQHLWNPDLSNGARALTAFIVVTDIAFAPDTKILAIAGSALDKRGMVMLFDVSTGEAVGDPLKGSVPFQMVAFSPNGQHVITTDAQNRFQVWTPAAGLESVPARQHDQRISQVAFTADSRYAATASWDQTVQIWDIATGAPLPFRFKHCDRVTSLSIAPDGKTVASGAWDGLVRLWTMPRALESQAFQFTGSIADASFTRSDREIVVRTGDVNAMTTIVEAGLEYPTSSLVALHMHHIDRDSGHIHVMLPGDQQQLADIVIAPSGQRVLSMQRDNGLGKQVSLIVQDLSSASQKASLPVTFQAEERDNDSRWLALSNSGELAVWQASSMLARVYKLEQRPSVEHELQLDQPITCCAISSNSQWIVIGTGVEMEAPRSGQCIVWNDGKEVGPSLEHPGRVNAIVFSRDDKQVASCSSDGTIVVWDLAERQEKHRIRYSVSVNALAFSPDGTMIAVGCEDGTARVWDLIGDPVPVTPPLKHRSAVTSVVFSGRATTLLTGTESGLLQTWDLSPNSRSLEEIERIGALLSLQRQNGSPVGPQDIVELWHQHSEGQGIGK